MSMINLNYRLRPRKESWLRSAVGAAIVWAVIAILIYCAAILEVLK